MRKHPLDNERGAILLFTLGVMIALLLIGTASSLFTRGEQRLAANVRDSTGAFHTAEAAAQWAHSRLRGADPALYFDDGATLAGSPVAFGGGSYEVAVGARDAAGRRTVTATGRRAGIERSLTATFRHFGLDPAGTGDCLGPGDEDADGICDGRPGILSNDDVTLPAGSRVDSYHGTGEYSAASAGARGVIATNGVLMLAGSSTIVEGDVFVGRGFEPGGNTHVGRIERTATLFLPPLPDHASVCSGVTNPALVDCNPPWGSASVLLAGTPPGQSLTVGSGQTVCMPPGEYCYRRILVQEGATLRIVDPEPGVSNLPTTIHLDAPSTGNAAFEVRGRLEFGSGMQPSLLRVFARGDVRVSGWSGAQVFGLFYAPRSAVRMNTHANGWTMDVYGLVAADRVVFGNGRVRFHVDEDGRFGPFCDDPGDPVCRPALVVREAWSENRG